MILIIRSLWYNNSMNWKIIFQKISMLMINSISMFQRYPKSMLTKSSIFKVELLTKNRQQVVRIQEHQHLNQISKSHLMLRSQRKKIIKNSIKALRCLQTHTVNPTILKEINPYTLNLKYLIIINESHFSLKLRLMQLTF